MGDVTLSLQAIALVGSLLTSLIVAIGTLCGVIAVLYRQVLKERDKVLDERQRLLSERDARLVDLWRDIEQKEIRITSLEAASERYQQLAANATAALRETLDLTRQLP